MKIKGIIFDLDGTLVNSIEDIADSMNAVLAAENHPTYSYEEHASFIGSGIRTLVEKALPNGADEEMIDKFFLSMITHYKENCTNKTFVYDDILELLQELQYRKIQLSVLSNKADALTKKVVLEKLPSIFNPVKGMTTEALKKPNPEVVLGMCEELGLIPKNTMYVGDTSVDIKTAKNAGMIAVACTWGFRTKKQLLEENPDYIIDSPLELIKLLS